MGKQGILIIGVFGFLGLSFSILNYSEDPETTIKPEIPLSQISRPLANTVWHWEDDFTNQETYQIKNWLAKVNKAVISTLGNYPFKTHFYIHRSTKGNEPVPWAHTSRSKKQGVHFHISMDYNEDEFLKDWTAPHEISHLSIPFVGSENSWFSEGYATFMQYQIMETQGVLTALEVEDKYVSRVSECKASYQTNLPFPEASDSLKKVWNYPDMYWGGVSFFWKLDKAYQRSIGKRLTSVIKMYVNCCRVNESSPRELCNKLDELTETKLASNLLTQYETEPSYLIFEGM